MQYTSYYKSPLGLILLAADYDGLTGLWFEKQKYYKSLLDTEHEEKELPVFRQTKEWLDIYFSGQDPNFTIPLHINGTDFQQSVWKVLSTIPYGETMTYKDIATKIAEERGLSRMSSQAVGGAVSHNKISIIIPCHRVVGSNGNLTGYAGGIEKKLALLQLENVNTSHFFFPK